MTLKEARINAGLSVLEAARAMNVSPQAVYQWERGETTPTVANLVGMAGLYCCPVDELLKPGRANDSA